MLFEVRGVLQNVLLGIRPVRRTLHRRLGKTGMNGDPRAAEKRLEWYLERVPVAGKRVLELGPGHTPDVLLLARERGAARSVGLDVEHLVEPKGYRERGVELDLYDGGRMPYANGTFDVVWSSDVLEHVRDPERTVMECARVLEPGGKLAAIIDLRDHYFLHIEERWLSCLGYSDLVWRTMTSNRSSFVNRWRASRWRSLFERAGFTLDTFDEQKSDLLRRLHREGRIRVHGDVQPGGLSEEDAATYRLEIVATKKR